MKKAKLFTSLLLVLMLLAVTMTGCGGGNGGTDNGGSDVEDNGDGDDVQKIDFPTKTITIICPFAAGGGTDAVARAIADIAKDNLGQSVVVENKTGGTGVTGMQAGMDAKADGYTATLITVELVTLPKMGLAPDTFNHSGFKHVALLNGDPSAITVQADAPWDTLEEFLEHARANPGKVSVGNAGSGSIWHLGTIGLEKVAGVEFLAVPYQTGANDAVVALLGGHIDAVAVSPAEVGNHVDAGTLKILGIASDERVDKYPDVKTYKEYGYDLAIGTFRGLSVPKDTPDEVVAILEEAFMKAAQDARFKEFMDNAGLGIDVRDSAGLQEKIAVEDVMFDEIIELFNMQSE